MARLAARDAVGLHCIALHWGCISMLAHGYGQVEDAGPQRFIHARHTQGCPHKSVVRLLGERAKQWAEVLVHHLSTLAVNGDGKAARPR